MSDTARLRRTVQRIAELLAAGDAPGLAALSGNLRLTADEIAEAIEEYPGRLALPPAGWLDTLAPTPVESDAIRAGVLPQFFLDLRLWDERIPEPRPHLVAEVILTTQPGELFSVEVCDLYIEEGTCDKGRGARPAADA